MAEYPGLLIWTDAYLADTTGLSTEEHGAYLLLLMAAWRTRTCSLPDDDVRLARMARVGTKKWRRIRPAVLEAFFDLDDGQWTQKRLLVERKRTAMLRHQRSEAGKASALKRQQTRSTSVGTERQPSTPSLYTKVDDGDEAAVRHALGRKVLGIIGALNDPSCRLDYSRVSAWLGGGATPEEILDTVTRVTARKTDGLPSSLKYFDKAIARTVQDRTDPLPAVERTSVRAKSREDRWLAGLNAAR